MLLKLTQLVSLYRSISTAGSASAGVARALPSDDSIFLPGRHRVRLTEDGFSCNDATDATAQALTFAANVGAFTALRTDPVTYFSRATC